MPFSRLGCQWGVKFYVVFRSFDKVIHLAFLMLFAAYRAKHDYKYLKSFLRLSVRAFRKPLSPESITVIVNGREFASFTINKRLKQGDSYWETDKDAIRPMSKGEYFIHGLRVNITKGKAVGEGNREDMMIEDFPDSIDTAFSTPFKVRGFSAWDFLDDLGNVTVEGILRHEPSHGGEPSVSLDLEITKITVGGITRILDGTQGIRHKRYIRVEYEFGTDTSFRSWHPGDVFRITGPARRDRDRTTFFEIHPKGQANVVKINP